MKAIHRCKRKVVLSGLLSALFGLPATCLALPADCDVTLASSQNFSQLQNVINTVADTNYDSNLKVCFQANTQIINDAASQHGAIRVRRDKVHLFADPGTAVAIKNFRTTSSLWENSAIVVDQLHTGFSVSNLTISTAGNYGSAIFLFDGKAESLTGLQLLSQGAYGAAIRIESTIPDVFRAGVRTIKQTNFSLGANQTGVSVVRAADADELSDLNFQLTGSSAYAISANGLRVAQIRRMSATGGGLSVGGGSAIGELSDVQLRSITGYALTLQNSSLGLMQRVGVTTLPSNATFPYSILSLNSTLGGVRKVTANGYGATTKVFTAIGGRIGNSSEIKKDLACAVPYLISATADEGFEGCR